MNSERKQHGGATSTQAGIVVDERGKTLKIGEKRYRWEKMNWLRLGGYTYDDDWYRILDNGKEKKIEEVKRLEKLERRREEARGEQNRKLQEAVLACEDLLYPNVDAPPEGRGDSKSSSPPASISERKHDKDETFVDLAKQRVKYRGKTYTYEMDDNQPGFFMRLRSDGVEYSVSNPKRAKCLKQLAVRGGTTIS